MSSPRRFKKGVTNVGISDALHNLQAMDPKKVHLEFYDFNRYVAADWTVTESDAACTQALVAGDGGHLLLTVSAGDDMNVFLQKPIVNFTLEVGKKFWWGARVAGSAPGTADYVAGLTTIDTAPVGALIASGVYYRMDDGDVQVDFFITNSGITALTAVGSALDIGPIFQEAVGLELEWTFDGVDTFKYIINGIEYGEVVTANFPTTELSLNFGLQAGTASADTMTIDWIYAAKER